MHSDSLEAETCCDHLYVAGIEYSGSAVINTVLDGSTFFVVFSANESVTAGFIIYWSCYSYFQTGIEGKLLLVIYDTLYEVIEWSINSNCSAIHLVSTHFDIEEGYDFLSMAGKEYTGTGPIDTIVEGSSFVATFNSDETQTATGFTILWSCYVS